MACPIMNRPSATEGDYTACLSVGFVTLKDPPKPVAKVVQERKMGTATNSPPVMTQETKHLA